jgi:hypothetical protein
MIQNSLFDRYRGDQAGRSDRHWTEFGSPYLILSLAMIFAAIALLVWL